MVCFGKIDRMVYFYMVTIKSDRSKEFIIEKAAPLFNKKGYAGTSMNDIMKATGMAKGGLYGNFKNKDEIAAMAFEYSFNRLKEDIASKVVPCKTAMEKLFAILQYYRNYTVNSPVEGGIMMSRVSDDVTMLHRMLDNLKHRMETEYKK